MEEEKGVVIHLVLSKYKDDVTPERIEEIIKGYANLVNLIPPMKSFRWGKDISAENRNQGFTHVFESTFESREGELEFLAHPAHLEFVNWALPSLDKVLSVDFKPTIVHL